MIIEMTLTLAPSHTFPMTDGRNIDMFPAPSELTVAQAAKMIGEPEGYIEELLKAKLVAYRVENGERLIERDSFLAHEEECREMEEAMADITRWSQEMGLYDD